jgi:hypothetical protein
VRPGSIVRRRRVERRHEVAARELAELYAEQRPARAAVLAGIEVLLNDLARGARRERVALARQVRGRAGLRDGGELGGNHGVLEPAVDVAAARHDRARRRARHAKDGEHVADAVDDRDRRG